MESDTNDAAKAGRHGERYTTEPDSDCIFRDGEYFACAVDDSHARDIAAELNTLTDALRLAVAENEAWRNADAEWDRRADGCCGDDIPPWPGIDEKYTTATDANATIAAVRKEIAP